MNPQAPPCLSFFKINFRGKDKEGRVRTVVLKWPWLKLSLFFIRPLQIKGVRQKLGWFQDSEAITSGLNETVGQLYLQPRPPELS